MRTITASLLLALAFQLLGFAPEALAQTHASTVAEASFRHKAPTELFEITRVVDGDTVYIQYGGKEEKLRLLSVDTEEKMDVSATKPATIFGQECALWAEEFFAAQAKDGQPAKIGVLFPGGKERRDIYGRLLCHVVLADGTDFNLKLVELGKSPYFNKYGNSLVCHDEFLKAQKMARADQLGIWNPKTNMPAEEGRPAAHRPYEKLLAWWNVRAEAIDNFRKRNARDPEHWIDAELPEALELAAERGGEVNVFCNLNRIFDEADGSKTFLMRSGDKQHSLRVLVAADQVKTHAKRVDFESLQSEFKQNYLFVRGKIIRGKRGFELVSESPAQWSLAGPDPE